MKDYLPLLIGLIWLGFTLYNKKQKGKNSKPGDATNKKRPSMLEQLLLGEQFNAVQTEAELSDSIYEVDEENVNNDDFNTEPIDSFDKKSPFLQYELSNFVEEGTQMINIDNSNYDEGNELMLTEDNNSQLIDFDLKRAIIYSEILHAPYI